MQHAALGRTDFCICHLAQLIVGEIIAVGAVFVYDPFVPEFVQSTHGALGVSVAGGAQEVERECAANSRRQFNTRASGGRELHEATDEHRMHPWRKRASIIQRRLPVEALGLWWAGQYSFQIGLHHFDHEQGIAPGLMKHVQPLVQIQLTLCHL